MKRLASFVMILSCYILAISSVAFAGAEEIITLNQAKQIARSQGNDYYLIDISYILAREQYNLARKGVGLGSIGLADSRTMRQDLDNLEDVIEERNEVVKALREEVKEQEKERDEVEAEGRPESSILELEREIEAAREELAEAQIELDDIRKSHSRLLTQYYTVRDLEDMAGSALQPAESGYRNAEDSRVIQPKKLDFTVENIFLSLLAMERQKEHGGCSLENLGKNLRREQLRMELGMTTSTAVKQVEAGLLQAEQGIKNLAAGEESMRRTFLRLLGLPSNYEFRLTSENITAGGISPAMTELPDFTLSLKYRSSLDNLERKKEDLEDTSTYDITRYQLAEANVELAEVQLEKTLQGLEENFKKRHESLLLAEEGVKIAAFELENKDREYAEAKIRYDLGTISGMELESAELSLLEARVKHEVAGWQHYLEYRAFLLAREGIEVEPFSLR